MKKLAITLALSVFSCAVVVLPAQASEVPPQNAKPLSEILQTVSGQGTGSISEAEFEHGAWEVKTCQASACQTLYIDPHSGKQLRSKPSDRDAVPPQGATPIADIVKRIEAQNLGTVTDVEFEHGSWSIHLNVNPMTTKAGQ